jgi:hypothetical protein
MFSNFVVEESKSAFITYNVSVIALAHHKYHNNSYVAAATPWNIDHPLCLYKTP